MDYKPKYKIGMTREPVDQPVDLMEIYHRVQERKRKLQEDKSDGREYEDHSWLK